MVLLSLLTSAAGGVVSNVASVATSQVNLPVVFCFRSGIEKLSNSSTQIENLIHDAALEPYDEESLAKTKWIKRLITVACSAEDVLDDVQYEVHRIVIEETSFEKNKLNFFCDLFNRVEFRFRKAFEIYKINTSLEDLHKQAASIGLVMPRRSNGGSTANRSIQHRETTSFFDKNGLSQKDAIIVGRDEVVSNIIAALTNNNNQEKVLSVVAIVGLGGIGKTTLARSVTKQLKDGEVTSNYFDTMLWVYVSNTFNVNSILRRMLESCEPATSNLSSQEALIESLRKKLTKKRVFLVLDDVWNEEKENWDILKKCLLQLNLAGGSTVVLTTRSNKVASIVEADSRWPLNTLSDDECWSMLKDRALTDPNAPITSDLEGVGRELAKKCAGLPLAAEVLGSLMRSKNSSNEWRSILENPLWQRSLENEDSKIMSVLMLSFDNLKSPLKQCFAYCSMLKRGSLIERDNLIQLWMAQGLLHPPQPIEMEDIGGEYFDTLLNNSLFQYAARNEDNAITGYMMHDLLHELAIEVSKFECWSPDFNEINVHDEIRHVARIPTPTLEVMSETSIARLRSLISDVPVSSFIFQNSRALRVLRIGEVVTQELLILKHLTKVSLDLRIGEVVTEELPDSLCKMKHLRYLELSLTKIKAVPKSISKLYNLQTLRLVGCHNCEGVPTLGHLPNLRCLVIIEMNKLKRVGAEFYGTSTTLFPVLKTLHICGCPELMEWMEPPRMSAEGEVKVFRCLEELKLIGCSKLTTAPSRFPCLKRLEIDEMWLTGNATEMLNNTKSLTYLRIRGYVDLTRVLEIYEELDQPDICEPVLLGLKNYLNTRDNPRLKSFQITHGFPSLRQLNFSSCNLFQSLEFGPDYCTSLQTLSVRDCHNLTSIPITQGLPSLRRLDLNNCVKLSSLGSGLNNCTSLQQLCISRCYELTSIPINKEGITSLREFRIDGTGLLYLPSGLQFCTSLQHLRIIYCKRLVFISPSYECDHPESKNQAVEIYTRLSGYFSSLEESPSLESIPPDLRRLLSCHCGKSKYLPTTFRHLTGLKTLHIDLSSIGLWEEPNAFLNSQLENLILRWSSKHKSLPQQFQHCTRLKFLKISGLQGLEALPQWLGKLTSLESLTIEFCSKLKYLPIAHLTKLKTLNIARCPLLEERYNEKTGRDWHKISHIPNVFFNVFFRAERGMGWDGIGLISRPNPLFTFETGLEFSRLHPTRNRDGTGLILSSHT